MAAVPTPRPLVRPLRAGEVAAAVAVSAAAFDFELREPDRREHWERRVALRLESDPEGAFAAELDGRLVGVAQAFRREQLWVLSLLTVLPGAQGSGAGRELFERALAYGASCDAGLIVSSNDPRAMRLYGRAGFVLRPTLESDGALDRATLPRPDARVREADAGDLEAFEAISRLARGAPHTQELAFALQQGAVLLGLGDDGFAVTIPGEGVWLLAAREEHAARTLLWHALALVGESERPAVRWITGDQTWALDVLLQAGFGLTAYGALAVRGAPGRLHPYIPSGPFA
jgi:ribosomal protein S18 acetylase RimI-like enzyme